MHIPEESGGEPEGKQNVVPQPTRQRRASQVPKKAIKVIKKVVPLKRPLRKKVISSNPQNRWVSFHSSAVPDKENEILSLIRGVNPQDYEYPAADLRRQSFDDKSGTSFTDRSASRFQSLPDVKRYAVLSKDDVDVWEDAEIPEDQDNLSTANLLIVYEGTEDDEYPDGVAFEAPPHVTFTSASASPSPVRELRIQEDTDLRIPEEQRGLFVHPSDEEIAEMESKEVKDAKPDIRK